LVPTGYQVHFQQLEIESREKLFASHLSIVEACSHSVAQQIHSLLQQYADVVVHSLSEEISFPIDPFVSLQTCFDQVDGLVMRTARPIALALLQWPRSYSQRNLSYEELSIACPEIPQELLPKEGLLA